MMMIGEMIVLSAFLNVILGCVDEKRECLAWMKRLQWERVNG
jgi:hypothetical protein